MSKLEMLGREALGVFGLDLSAYGVGTLGRWASRGCRRDFVDRWVMRTENHATTVVERRIAKRAPWV